MKNFYSLLFILICCTVANAQFTPGNIVVTRTGSVTAPAPLTTSTTQVSLLEYTPLGTLVQTIPLASTGTDKLTIGGLGSGGTSLEGQLSLSQDRNYLSLIGYDVPAGEVTSNTAISAIAIAAGGGGTGYSFGSIVSITGGGGTGATAVINQVTAGAIVGLKITNGGSGYTSSPTIEVSGGTGFIAGAITRIPYWQSFSTKKVIARVGANGVVDYSTKFAGSSPTNAFASPANGIVKKAVTVDGSKYWYAANRLEFIAFGSTAASTNVNAGDAPRTIEIVNNQLYYIMGFNATGFKFTNTALPEAVSTSTSTGLAMSSNSSPLGFAMVDLDPAVSWNSTGYDLVYVVDSSGGLEKYYYDGAAWIPVNSRYLPLASPLNNPISFGTGTTLKPAAQIAVTLNASNQPVIAVIYGDAQAVGDGTSEKNGLAIVTDTSGRTGTMVSPTNITVAYPAAPAANYAFRGVSFTPGSTTIALGNCTGMDITTYGSVTTSICAGKTYVWPANGLSYNTQQSGLTYKVGCNTATLNLIVTPNSNKTTVVTACGSYTWNGTTYTTSGIKVGTTTNCVTEKLDLTIIPSPKAGINGILTVCAGTTPSESELFAVIGTHDQGGTWTREGVVYTYTVNATSPCATAATATVTLTVAPLSATSTIRIVPATTAIPSIKISTQTWTTKNLDVSTYRDGTPIPQVTDATEWANLTTGAWCYYNNDPANGAIYGKLYNWYAIAGIYDNASLSDATLRKQFAPLGWHVPSDGEWTALTDYLGGASVAGGKMKETGTTHWFSPNTGATNSIGFTGLPGGYRYYQGSFSYIGSHGFWRSSSEFDSNSAWYLKLFYGDGDAFRSGNNKAYKVNGFSVRLLKD